jgi:hypothetical protein
MFRSSPAESNHSSYCSQIGPECAEEPAVAVKQMIIRQNDILKERNIYLSDYKFCLMAQSRREQVGAVRTAHLFLGESGFTIWFKEWEQSSNYKVEEIEHNRAMVAHSVHRKGTREELSRVLITHLVPCSCACKVSYRIQQYCHDLAINGVFNLGKFSNPERWKLRLLKMSQDTGSSICQSL